MVSTNKNKNMLKLPTALDAAGAPKLNPAVFCMAAAYVLALSCLFLFPFAVGLFHLLKYR